MRGWDWEFTSKILFFNAFLFLDKVKNNLPKILVSLMCYNYNTEGIVYAKNIFQCIIFSVDISYSFFFCLFRTFARSSTHWFAEFNTVMLSTFRRAFLMRKLTISLTRLGSLECYRKWPVATKDNNVVKLCTNWFTMSFI